MAEIVLHDGKVPVMLRWNVNCWELCWQKNLKDKDTGIVAVGWTPEYFYAKPEQALQRLLNMKVGHSDASTLKELVAAIHEARTSLMSEYNTQAKG